MRRSLLTHLALFTLVAVGLLLGTATTVAASTSTEVAGASAIPESPDADSTAGEQTMDGEDPPKPEYQPSFSSCISIKQKYVYWSNLADRYWDEGNYTEGDGWHDSSMTLLHDWWNLCSYQYGPMGHYIRPGELRS